MLGGHQLHEVCILHIGRRAALRFCVAMEDFDLFCAAAAAWLTGQLSICSESCRYNTMQ